MYDHVAMALQSGTEVDVLTYDVRGQGRSNGARCHVNNFGEYIDDLDALIDKYKSKFKYNNS